MLIKPKVVCTARRFRLISELILTDTIVRGSYLKVLIVSYEGDLALSCIELLTMIVF
jgi:hypothetical protein